MRTFTIKMSIEIKEFEDRKEYYKNGVLHNDDDLPARVWINGDKEEWYKNGLKNRDGDLPSEIWKITTHLGSCTNKTWYINDKIHRYNGPAVLLIFSHITLKKYFWFGVQVSQQKHNELSSEYNKKYNQAVETIKKLRNRVKRYSAMCGLTPKKLQRVLGVLKKREFCEWWWHPENPGGKNHLRNMRNFVYELYGN